MIKVSYTITTTDNEYLYNVSKTIEEIMGRELPKHKLDKIIYNIQSDIGIFSKSIWWHEHAGEERLVTDSPFMYRKIKNEVKHLNFFCR